jgi:hypothetical protein
LRLSLSSGLLAVLVAAGALAACSDVSGPDRLTAPTLGAADLAPRTNEATETGAAGRVTTSLDAGMCLDVSSASRSNGSLVIIWRCHDNANQQWSYTAAGELRVYGTMCLDAPNNTGADGDRLIIWGCHGGSNQQWTRTSTGELRGLNGKCVDLNGGRAVDGASIILYTCHAGANQKWTLASSAAAVAPPAPAPAPPPAPVPPPAPAPAPAPAPVLTPGDAAGKVFALMGAVPSVSSVESIGGVFSRYEQDFRTHADRQWSLYGSRWDQANYYDRAMIYYVWWARTGNSTYLERAHALVLDYRKNYVEANNYGVAPHWALFDGLALHYLLTGDEASRTAVGRMADVLSAPYYMENLDDTGAEMENRMQARVLLGFVIANQIQAPSRSGQNWANRAREALTKILASQSSDGAYRMRGPINQCGYNKPFMVGLLNDAMVRYHTLFERDGRILPSIKKSVDYMWANDWRAGANAFVYLDGVCNGEAVYTAGDLNNMISTGFGFVYQQTRDVTYRTRGDAVFAGGVTGAFLSGTKQFNQEYTSSYRYLMLRQ